MGSVTVTANGGSDAVPGSITGGYSVATTFMDSATIQRTESLDYKYPFPPPAGPDGVNPDWDEFEVLLGFTLDLQNWTYGGNTYSSWAIATIPGFSSSQYVPVSYLRCALAGYQQGVGGGTLPTNCNQTAVQMANKIPSMNFDPNGTCSITSPTPANLMPVGYLSDWGLTCGDYYQMLNQDPWWQNPPSPSNPPSASTYNSQFTYVRTLPYDTIPACGGTTDSVIYKNTTEAESSNAWTYSASATIGGDKTPLRLTDSFSFSNKVTEDSTSSSSQSASYTIGCHTKAWGGPSAVRVWYDNLWRTYLFDVTSCTSETACPPAELQIISTGQVHYATGGLATGVPVELVYGAGTDETSTDSSGNFTFYSTAQDLDALGHRPRITATLTVGGTGGVTTTVTAFSSSPVNVVIPPRTATVSATPTIINFSHGLGGTSPAPQEVSLTSGGGSSSAPLAFTAATTDPWLSAAPLDGTTPSTLNVSLNPAGLAALVAGTYAGSVTVAALGSNSITIPVTLNVYSVPTLSASINGQPATSVILSTATAGQTTSPSIAVVLSSAALSGGQAIGFNVAVNSTPSWLQVTPTQALLLAGGTPVTVTANVAGLSSGTYNGTVTVTAQTPAVAALTLPVSLTVVPVGTVTLTVATNPTGLQASIGASGPYMPAPISQQVPANQTQFISVTTPQFVTAAGTGYSFTGWSTGGSTPTTTVQPSSNFTATANFAVACYALTVNVQPASSGAVGSVPASGGLSGLPANCYAPGTVVTLTALGFNGYTLQSWTGATPTGTANTATVTINGPTTVTATFALYPAPSLTFGGGNWGYSSGTAFQITGYIGNNGASYNNIMVTQVVWMAATGTGTISNTTPLPVAIGNLAGGTVSGNITLTSTMPTTVTGFTVCVSGTAVSPVSGLTVAWMDNQNCGHVFPVN
jgi:hypothetical protein